MKTDYEYDYNSNENDPYSNGGDQKKPGPAGCIIGIIFLLWFAGSVLLAIHYSNIEAKTWLVPIVVLHIFIVISLIDTVQRLIKKQKPQLMLILITAGSIAGIIFVCIYHFNNSEALRELLIKLLVVAFLMIFITIGITTIAKATLGRRLVRDRCTKSVYAVCKKADEKIKTVNNKMRRVYDLVYEIDADGETVELHENIAAKSIHLVGEARELFINPDNPAEFYDPDEITNSGDEIMAGVMFTVIPTIMLVLTLIYAF